MIALLDCNNFYVSCERLFNRKLIGKPVVVLSNNDGCVISRSNEAKKLGILMGEPFFKIRNRVKSLGIYVCSSNYSFYGDISNRVMRTIKNYCDHVEIYSIDEAFINLEKIKECEYFCYNLKKRILKFTGIPVSIGIGQTKTLSKIANKFAKDSEKNDIKIDYQGVYKINCDENLDSILKLIDIRDIWGIGKRLSIYFKELGFNSAFDLKKMNQNFARQKKGILVQKTILELKGMKCYEISDNNNDKRKSICVSRSFGQKLIKYEDIREALVLYVQKASEKLRRYNLYCGIVNVFLKTSNYKKKYYKNSASYIFKEPTSDSRQIWLESDKLLKSIYLRGYEYNKVGVILNDLKEKKQIQSFLFSNNDSNNKKSFEENSKLMSVIDEINRKFGEGKIRLSSDSVGRFKKAQKSKESERKWFMKSDFSSPCYTTKWCDIPFVNTN